MGEDEIIIEDLADEEIIIEETSNNDISVSQDNIVNIGTTDHDELRNRNISNQHPISAITGLQEIINNLEGTYFSNFTNSDWVINGQQYQLTITQAQHLLSNPYISKLEMLKDGDYKAVSMFGSKLLPNGSLIIISDLQYSGRILLKGGK